MGPAPGPRRWAAWKLLPALRRDAAGTLLDVFRTHGDVSQFYFGRRLNTLIAHPDHVRQVLVDNAANYLKGVAGEAFRPLLGNGLLTAEGAAWRRHRDLVQPAFRAQRLASYLPVVAEEAQGLAQHWRARTDQAAPINLSRELNRLTFRFIARALLGIEPDDESARVAQAFERANREGTHRLRSLLKIPLAWPTAHNVAYRAAVDFARAYAARHLRERRSVTSASEDLLAALSRPESGLDEEEAVDEIATLLFAGHETTTNALSWALGLLAQHRDMAEQARAEIERTLSGRPPDADGLSQLAFVRAVFQEAMRLFPPIYAFQRRAIASDQIQGFDVPAGAGVTISPYVTHRHPLFWPEPSRFQPDRFLGAAAQQRHRFAYLPFGAGPRTCIGANLAMMEGVAILSVLLPRFDFALRDDHLPAPESLISLAPRGGLWAHVRNRNS